MNTYNKPLRLLALSFFLFILWIIYMADTGTKFPTVISTIVNPIPIKDKVGHFVLYGLLTFCFNFGFNFKKMSIFKKRFYIGTIIVLTFAIIEEFTQIAIPNRNFDFKDIAADFVGISLFSYLSTLFQKRFTPKKKSSVTNHL